MVNLSQISLGVGLRLLRKLKLNRNKRGFYYQEERLAFELERSLQTAKARLEYPNHV